MILVESFRVILKTNPQAANFALLFCISYNTIVLVKIFYFKIELTDFLFSLLVVVFDGVAGHLDQLVVVASDQEDEGITIGSKFIARDRVIKDWMLSLSCSC